MYNLLSLFTFHFMLRISKTQLAATLSTAIHADVGLQGLNTLIYGWLTFRHYSHTYRNALYNRGWLYLTEVLELSDYAGYNLMTGERLPDTSPIASG